MAILQFDARNIAPDDGQMDPVPAGWYYAQVIESKIEPTKDGNGTKLVMLFSLLEGKYANRKIYNNFNIRNPNAIAEQIAFKQLSALCHAVERLVVQDTQELHGIPFKVKLAVTDAVFDENVPGKVKYPARNEVKAFRSVKDPQEVDNGANAVATTASAKPVPAGFGQSLPPAVSPMPSPAVPVAPMGQTGAVAGSPQGGYALGTAPVAAQPWTQQPVPPLGPVADPQAALPPWATAK